MTEPEMPEKYKRIYKELDIKMDPHFGSRKDNETDLGDLVAKLALFFSDKNNEVYNAFIRRYDWLRRETPSSYHKYPITTAAEKAFRHATKRPIF